MRDLTIEYLMRADAERARFLGATTTAGLELALSVGGGVHGERVIPLIKSESDAEIVGRRLVSVFATSRPADYRPLLATLATALRARNVPRGKRAWITQITRTALETIAARWRRSGRALSSTELDQYWAASRTLKPKPSEPNVDKAWNASFSQLKDDDLPLGFATLESFDTFLTLAATIKRHRPRYLRTFDFPDVARPIVVAWATRVVRDAEQAERRVSTSAWQLYELRDQAASAVRILRRFIELGAAADELTAEALVALTQLQVRCMSRIRALDDEADEEVEDEEDEDEDDKPQHFDLAAFFSDL